MFQRHEGFDLPELIQKYVGPVVVGFFVFVLPAIRAAQTARKQREELKRRTLERGTAPPGEEQEGRKAWDELLQGRGTPPPAPPAPPPLPPRSRIPSRSEPAELIEEESLEENAPRPLVELPSSRLPSAAEGEEDDERTVEEQVATRERQESLRQVEVAAAEYAAASPYRSEVAPQAASAVPIVSRPAAASKGAAEVWLFPLEAARDRRAALRRAVVLREVLGPPLGLR